MKVTTTPTTPPLVRGGGEALARLIPLSEERPLSLLDPLQLQVESGKTYDWDEVTHIRPGERRVISVNVIVNQAGQGQMLRVFTVPKTAELTVLQSVTVAAEASWLGCIAIKGLGEAKIRRTVELEGKGAEVKLSCVGILDDQAKITVADEIFTRSPETKSQILTKLVMNDASRSEARARIVVAQSATDSQAHERLDHLLLGDQAKASAIPELEVNTDKVTGGHAATASRPEAKQVWYLESRGLDRAQANRLLIQGFLEPAWADLPSSAQAEIRQVMFT